LIEKLTKEEAKRFEIQEFGFWQFCIVSRQLEIVSEDDDDETERERRKGMNQETFESTAKPEQLEVYWRENVSQLTLTSHTPFQKISVAARSLKLFAELIRPFDPLICALSKTGHDPNPWLIKFDKQRPSEYPNIKRQYRLDDVKLWTNSFEALLKDTTGLTLFREFVTKELSAENLEFWERVNLLEETSTRAEFKASAILVFKEFIQDGSLKEVNIPSHCKGPLSLIFQIDGEMEIPYDCYFTAQEHIFTLMQTDSYPRFCASKILNNFAKKLKAEKKSLSHRAIW
jgi:regulator of G-protein signaling